MGPPRRAALALGVAAVLLNACSDGDDESSATTTTATVSEATTTTAAPATDDEIEVDVEVDGPITGGQRGLPYNPMPAGLADEFGYVEEEHFVTGTATTFHPSAPLGTDGRWEVAEAGTAPFTTRIIVRRPDEPADFNGIVLVEWLNVSAGRDSDPDFGFLHPLLLAEGYAYVGVSAQATGVHGGDARLEVPGVPAEALAPLQEWDPERYAPLSHPGDEYSYDIFSQMASLARSGADASPLSGYDVTTVLAAGESQSAGRMVTYVNAVHPVAAVFDGFLVHSRGSTPSPVDATPEGEPEGGTLVRDDVDVPVLVFQTETDLEFLRSVQARQPDSDHVVTWEVAGTAHADASTLEYGRASGEQWATTTGFDPGALCGQVNNGPQAEVLRAALDHLRAWVVEGDPPPTSPPIEVADAAVVRDELGIAVGGIRTPPVDAPIAVLTGAGNPSSVFCSLFGQAFPLPPDVLTARYGTTDGYVDAVRTSAEAAVASGFLLDEDADAMVAAAGEVQIG